MSRVTLVVVWKLRQQACLLWAAVALSVAFSCSKSDDGAPAQASVLCGFGENPCGTKKCDALRGCVECAADSDCSAGSAGKPFCVAGACAGCRTNTDCTAPLPSCWPSDHQCHASCTDGSCPTTAPRCDAVSGACTGCTNAAECASPIALCDDTLRECVECKSANDCPGSAPRCILGTGRCARCIFNSDCPASTPICDAESLECRPGCTDDSQCATPTVHCDPAGHCAECLRSQDCVGDKHDCVEGFCK